MPLNTYLCPVARLSCRACEFEKRENRLGSKRVLGRLGTELVVAQVGSMLPGSRPTKGIEKKGSFIEFVLACLSTGGEEE